MDVVILVKVSFIPNTFCGSLMGYNSAAFTIVNIALFFCTQDYSESNRDDDIQSFPSTQILEREGGSMGKIRSSVF